MRLSRRILFIIFLLLIGGGVVASPGLVWAQQSDIKTQVKGGVAKDQPVSLGGVFFDQASSAETEMDGQTYYVIFGDAYVYSEYLENRIKIIHQAVYVDIYGQQKTSAQPLVVPLDGNKAFLTTPGNKQIPAENLVIEVVDPNHRIRVMTREDYDKREKRQAEKERRQQAFEKKLEENPLLISGIVGGSVPFAIIGENMYKKGDKIKGSSLRVAEIGANYVEFMERDGSKSRQYIGK